MNLPLLWLCLMILDVSGCTGSAVLTLQINYPYVKDGRSSPAIVTCTCNTTTTEKNLEMILTEMPPEVDQATLRQILKGKKQTHVAIPPDENDWIEVFVNGNNVTPIGESQLKIPCEILGTRRFFRVEITEGEQHRYDQVEFYYKPCPRSGCDSGTNQLWADLEAQNGKRVNKESFTSEWERSVEFVEDTETFLIVNPTGGNDGFEPKLKKLISFTQFSATHGGRFFPAGNLVRMHYELEKEKEITVRLTLSAMDITIVTAAFKHKQERWIFFLSGAQQTFRPYDNQFVETNYVNEDFVNLLSDTRSVIQICNKRLEPGQPPNLANSVWTDITQLNGVKVEKAKVDGPLQLSLMSNMVQLIALPYHL